MQLIREAVTLTEILELVGLVGRRRDLEPQYGRQNSGYTKYDVSQRPEVQPYIQRCLDYMWLPRDVPHDAWFLEYPTGSFIPSHTDPVESGQHHRLNILVYHDGLGGELFIGKEHVPLRVGDGVYFRSDLEEHEVTRVEAGERIVFSVGALWAK